MASPEPFSGPTPFSVRLLELACAFVQFGLPWVLLVLALLQFRQIVGTLLEGRSETQAWVVMLLNVNRTRAFILLFGVLGVIYGLQQRNLRRAAVSRLRARVAELERSFNTAQEPTA